MVNYIFCVGEGQRRGAVPGARVQLEVEALSIGPTFSIKGPIGGGGSKHRTHI